MNHINTDNARNQEIFELLAKMLGVKREHVSAHAVQGFCNKSLEGKVELRKTPLSPDLFVKFLGNPMGTIRGNPEARLIIHLFLSLNKKRKKNFNADNKGRGSIYFLQAESADRFAEAHPSLWKGLREKYAESLQSRGLDKPYIVNRDIFVWFESQLALKMSPSNAGAAIKVLEEQGPRNLIFSTLVAEIAGLSWEEAYPRHEGPKEPVSNARVAEGRRLTG